MADEIIIETTSQQVIEVSSPGPQGPAGAAGTGLETLTSKGDTLYRGETTGERLPIGTTGQVLKVSAQGIPNWANESGAVTSVNGATGAVTVEPAVNKVTATGATTLTASRNTLATIETTSASDFTINLPTASNENQDRVRIVYAKTSASPVKANIVAGAFGTFAMSQGETADFFYSTELGPARWIKLFQNNTRPAPAGSDQFGIAGQLAFDGTYLYVAVASNTWRRVPVANWS